jgi:hypothetical protein
MPGEFTEACLEKLRDPKVKEAISGFTSPSSPNTSERSVKEVKNLPLVDTQMMASGHWRRTAEMIAW